MVHFWVDGRGFIPIRATGKALLSTPTPSPSSSYVPSLVPGQTGQWLAGGQSRSDASLRAPLTRLAWHKTLGHEGDSRESRPSAGTDTQRASLVRARRERLGAPAVFRARSLHWPGVRFCRSVEPGCAWAHMSTRSWRSCRLGGEPFGASASDRRACLVCLGTPSDVSPSLLVVALVSTFRGLTYLTVRRNV